MFWNFIVLSFRHLRSRMLQSAINIMGLSIGLGACIIIFFYVRYELTFDAFHKNAGRIFMIYKERHLPTGMQITEDTWAPLSAAVSADFPEIEHAARYYDGNFIVEAGGQRYDEKVSFTDPDLFHMFDFNLLVGDPSALFNDPGSVFISKSKADKYFGDGDPLGKAMTVSFDMELTVNGVFADIPPNSSFNMDIVVPLTSVPDYDNFKDEWGGSFLFTWIELKEGTTKEVLESKFPDFIAKIWNDELNKTMKLKLLPLTKYHDDQTHSNRYAYILLAVALSILVVGCLNFMNIKTASSLDRIGEMGLRKVVGSTPAKLAALILSESVLVSLTALIMGIILAEVFIPYVNDLYDVNLKLYRSSSWEIYILLLGIGVLVGILSGLYPAILVTRSGPVAALRREGSRGRKGLMIRNILVVFQFAISAVLVIGTASIYRQVRHLKDADLRFDRDNLVVLDIDLGRFRNPDSIKVRLTTFRDRLDADPRILGYSASTHVPGRWANWFSFVYPADREESQRLRMRRCYVDDKFFDNYGIRVVQGRNFSARNPTDADASFILNEAAMKDIGWTDVEGKQIRAGDRVLNLIGVVEDYHYQSLVSEVEPVVHLYRPTDNPVHNFLTIRLGPGAINPAMDDLRRYWKEVDPDQEMSWFFMDDQFDSLYRNQDRLGELVGIFSVLAILIAVIGLYAMSAVNISGRTREIGIRKVLGAQRRHVLISFFRSYGFLVLLANLAAWPLAWLLIRKWLEDFAYRQYPPWWLFVLTLVLALMVCLATVSYHAIRAAGRNPADSLRYE